MEVFVQTVVGGLTFGAIYALVALGFSLIYRTMALVNFAHGDVLMLGAYLGTTMILSFQLPFVVALVAATLLTAVVGVGMERILRPLENKDLDLMLIGTLGFGIVLESVAIIVWGPAGQGVHIPIAAAPIDIGGIIVQPYDLIILAAAAAIAVTLYMFLGRTKLGLAMQASAMDFQAASAMGIDVGRMNAIAFAIGSALAAIAGNFAAPLLYVEPTVGVSLGIRAFAAAMLGGFGSIPGAIIGGLAIGLLDSFATGIFQGYGEVVTFVTFALLISLRPTGIFGEQTISRA